MTTRAEGENSSRLTRERIAKAALGVVGERGASGFTVRAVADALGVTPMALYHHVTDKAALAALTVEAAMRERGLAIPTGSWQEDLWQMASWMREGALAHPAIYELQRAFRIYTQEMLRMADRWVSLWQQSGLELDNALLAAAASSAAITGLLAEEALSQQREAPDESMLSMLPNARMLITADRNPAAVFELATRGIISGLYTQLSKRS